MDIHPDWSGLRTERLPPSDMGMPDVARPLDVGAMKEQTDKAIEVPSDTVSVLDEKNLLVTEGKECL